MFSRCFIDIKEIVDLLAYKNVKSCKGMSIILINSMLEQCQIKLEVWLEIEACIIEKSEQMWKFCDLRKYEN